MAKSRQVPGRDANPTHGKSQTGGVCKRKKKQGRPKTWTTLIQRKMIWLYLFSDMTNMRMAQYLQDTTGVRTMQEYRRDLLTNADSTWRPQNRLHMHQRLERRWRYGHFTPWMHDRVVKRSSQNQNLHQFTGNGSPREVSMLAATPLLITITSLPRNRKEKQYGIDPHVVATIEDTSGRKQTHQCLCSELPAILRQIVWHGRRIDAFEASCEVSVYIHSIRLDKIFTKHQRDLIVALGDISNRLAVNCCQLTEAIVPQFSTSGKLRYLNLRRNRLTRLMHLPQSLEIVDLSQNTFRQFPACLQQLKALRLIQISHNLITCLPSWLSELVSLITIHLDDNPFDMHTHSLIDYAQTVCMTACKKDRSSYCKTAFTRQLQDLLLQDAIKFPDVQVDLPICICVDTRRSFMPLSVSDDDNELATPVAAADVQILPDWESILRRADFVRASVQSSRSSITFASVTSANPSVLSLIQSAPWRNLMLVRCCARQVYCQNQDCVHRRLDAWLSAGAAASPPIDLVSLRDLGDNTALHFAALLEAPVPALCQLVKHGCDPLQINTKGETFLHLVSPGFWKGVRRELVQLVLLLREHKFPFCNRDHKGNTIFHNVLIVDIELNLFLAEHLWPCRNMRNSAGYLPLQLHDKLYHQQLPVDECWITCHERSDTSQNSIPAIVVPRPFLDIQYEDDSNCRNHSQHLSSLHQFTLALYRDYRGFRFDGELAIYDPLPFLRFLLVGPLTDVNAYDGEGRTVLMAMIRGFYHRWPQHQWVNLYNAEQCIKKLLNAGADVHRRDRTGHTALHYAIIYCAPPIVRSLVQAGASVNACNQRGVSVLRLLRDKQAEHTHNLKVSTRYEQCLTVLLDHDAQIDPPPEWQWMSATAIAQEEEFSQSNDNYL